VVFQEAGHWWLPFVKYRIDEFYEMHPEDIAILPRKRASGERYLEQTPSVYLEDNVYLCTQPFALPRNSREATNMLDLSMAKDMFVYSSDWPHQTLDPPTWFYTTNAFDQKMRDAILHENANEILNIGS
jgi:predicted TIM-barrel fold metal-dependent hydrolase